MGYERRISIFRNGRSQAVRIPKEFELPGKEATIRRDGNRLVIEPIERKPNLLEVLATLEPRIDDPLPEPVEHRHLSLGEWLATLDPLPPEDRFPEIEDYPPEPIDL